VAAIRGGVSSLFSAAYLVAAAYTVVFQSKERLLSRWPLAGFVVLHATAAVMGGLPPLPKLTSIFGMIHFEALVFIVGTTIFVIAAMRESREARYLLDSQTDALTGLANRRAFLEFAERVAARCARNGEPLAIAVFDLDHFKLINDTFGHAFGDDVLRLFAGTARAALRPGDLISAPAERSSSPSCPVRH
jgi:predicted signal transduction protein with EAL and GGDEF domain